MIKTIIRNFEKRFRILKRSSLISDFYCPRILISEERTIASGYSGQYGQDLALESFITLLPKKDSYFFVDIGAHDGISLSNSKFLDSKANWSGVCIEANPHVFQKLVKNRTKCTCLNVAVSDKNGTVRFLVNSGRTEMLSGIVENYPAKLKKRIQNEIRSHGGNSIEIEVESRTLETIALEVGVSAIDLLFIDVEGGEYSILKAIDFSKIKVNAILIERNYSSRPIYQLLLQNDFTRIIALGGDDLYISNNYLRP